jgi:hypothetical protein
MFEDYIYTKKSLGGLGFINNDLNNCVRGLRCVWRKRYICGAKEHWADLLDVRFGVTQDSRAKVTLIGDKKLLKLAKSKLRCLSEYIEAFAILTRTVQNRSLILVPQPATEDMSKNAEPPHKLIFCC